MRVDNRAQGLALLLALALGLAAGLLYDLLRPPRWRFRGAALLLDTLYCLALGAAFFVFAMAAGDGRLGLDRLGAAWTGVLLYHHLLSPLCLPFISKLFQLLDFQTIKFKKILKKFMFFQKKFLKKSKNALY